MATPKVEEWREEMMKLSRKELFNRIEEQDPELLMQVRRIEWVFANKLTHLTWEDGSPIDGRPLTKKELVTLLDPPFIENEEWTEYGIPVEEQKKAHIASDPVLWAKHFLGVKPRAYQILILREEDIRVVLRLGRRAGKTFCLALLCLHYAYTTTRGRVLVMAPTKAQVGLIYEEINNMSEGTLVEESIVRAVASPQYEINMSNGSTIRLFTTGMKSGSKSDGTRGQEAHLIILDEMDYMGSEDLDALFAMLQKTDENQPEKRMIGASTPRGIKGRYYDWCTGDLFKEFWYPAYCFPAGQMVKMADGSYKEIQEITVGDLVMTEEGPNRVSRTFERDYEGDIIDIRAAGNNTIISATPEHPFYAAPRSRKQTPSYGGIKDGYDWAWTNAGDLVEPITRNLNSGMWLNMPVDNRISVSGDEFKTNDLNVATLIGWYMAEGHLEREDTTVGWTLGRTEEEYVEEILEAIESLNLGDPNITHRDSTVLIRLTNPAFAAFLKEHVGKGSTNKLLSQDVMLAPLDFQKLMLEAYGKGDGWIYESGVDYRTSSPQMARQVRDISLRLGRIPSFRRDPNSPVSIGQYGPYEASDTYLVSDKYKGGATLGTRFVNDSEIAALAKAIERRPYSGKVYNFEVENTNSYLVEGILVHNCNPHFTKEKEKELRQLYNENSFRQEVEADWGEPAEGVYPRKYVDMARQKDWDYLVGDLKKGKKYLIGVDWDKYRAGPNIVVLEIIKAAQDPFEREDIGKVRVAYREELPQTEYALTEAVDRIIYLNKMLDPEFIYVDRGAGDTQVELLNKKGLEDPDSGLKKKVKGVHFASTMEVIDPATKQKDKKRVKLLLVENLRNMFEQKQLLLPNSDEGLYKQLISYVVKRVTTTGAQVFEAIGEPDHAHDALLLACMAYMEHYNDLLKASFVTSAKSINPMLFDSSVESKDRARLKDVQKGPKKDGVKPYRKMRRAGVRSRGTVSRRNI